MAVQESRELDVVVHGATGFAGRLVAAHLVRHAPDGVRVGLSGRSPDRLREVRDGLGDRAAAWPLLVADAQDDAALRDVARRTRVIASTVGPYERFGLPLTRACAGEGTDYVDLTGEVLFMRASIDANHATAQRTGARLVHACGFDSVPSDLGVLLLARAAATHGLGELGRTRFVLTGASGGFSGGTVDSLRAQVDRMRSDRQARRLVADPYSLSPDRGREPDRTVDGPGDGPDSWGVTWDEDAGRWLAPFVMGPVNSRVVRRSNALSDYSYGRGFTYRESVGLPGRVLGAPLAAGLAVGTGALGLGMALPPTRRLLDKVLPAVGTGPDEKAREAGYFSVRLHSRTSTGRLVQATVSSPGDPGYAATARMLGESALALALDRDRLPEAAGVLTPATALGEVLVGRLRDAGMTLQVL
ncbi:saccharopine dehydrogenase family protein [Aquipuribacter sp. MA13-13]|uniref:saccharopine dehydrogenase family protein n=1 Tax=Aquipuribacter sp. MA13-13 TaxID=3440840 RepID=UPI003EEF7893